MWLFALCSWHQHFWFNLPPFSPPTHFLPTQSAPHTSSASNITFRYSAKPRLVKTLAIITFLCRVKLFNIGCSPVREPSLLAVPEVTVRSVTPISAAFALAIFRVKRTVNPAEEAGGSQHYLQVLLSCPHEPARPSFSASFSVNSEKAWRERRNNNNVPTAPCWIGRGRGAGGTWSLALIQTWRARLRHAW